MHMCGILLIRKENGNIQEFEIDKFKENKSHNTI